MADNLETLGGVAADAVGPDAAPAEPQVLDDDEDSYEDYDMWKAREVARNRPPGVKLHGVRIRLKPSLTIRAELAISDGFSSSDTRSLNQIILELVDVGDGGSDPYDQLVAGGLDDSELQALFAWAFSNLKGRPMAFVEAVQLVSKLQATQAGPAPKAPRGVTRTRRSSTSGARSSATSGASTE